MQEYVQGCYKHRIAAEMLREIIIHRGEDAFIKSNPWKSEDMNICRLRTMKFDAHVLEDHKERLDLLLRLLAAYDAAALLYRKTGDPGTLDSGTKHDVAWRRLQACKQALLDQEEEIAVLYQIFEGKIAPSQPIAASSSASSSSGSASIGRPASQQRALESHIKSIKVWYELGESTYQSLLRGKIDVQDPEAQALSLSLFWVDHALKLLNKSLENSSIPLPQPEEEFKRNMLQHEETVKKVIGILKERYPNAFI
jgi:hypothetical protein